MVKVITRTTTKVAMMTLALGFPLVVSAQSTWELPSQDARLSKEKEATEAAVPAKKEKAEKVYEINEKDREYLAGTVPEKDGKVVFSAELSTTGSTAEENYQKVYDYLDRLAHEESQTKKSQVAIVNPEEHTIVGTYSENLILYKAALELDRTGFNYVIMATCTDEGVNVSIERLSFDYNYTKDPEHMTAEETITDKELLTGNGTRLRKTYAKFRRATVDRMREIIAGLRKALE